MYLLTRAVGRKRKPLESAVRDNRPQGVTVEEIAPTTYRDSDKGGGNNAVHDLAEGIFLYLTVDERADRSEDERTPQRKPRGVELEEVSNGDQSRYHRKQPRANQPRGYAYDAQVKSDVLAELIAPCQDVGNYHSRYYADSKEQGIPVYGKFA